MDKCQQCGEEFPEYFPECPTCGWKKPKKPSSAKKSIARVLVYVAIFSVGLALIIKIAAWNLGLKTEREAKIAPARQVDTQRMAEARRQAEIRERAAKNEEAERLRSLPCGIEQSGWDGSVWPVERYLDKNLPDRKSFEAIEWSKVFKSGADECVVRVKYRAKNMFGGYVIENKLFTFNSSGQVTGVENAP